MDDTHASKAARRIRARSSLLSMPRLAEGDPIGSEATDRGVRGVPCPRTLLPPINAHPGTTASEREARAASCSEGIVGGGAAHGRSGSRLCENRTRALVVPRSRLFWPPSLPEVPEYEAQTGNREHFLGIWVTAAGFSHSLGRYRPLAASVLPLDLLNPPTPARSCAPQSPFGDLGQVPGLECPRLANAAVRQCHLGHATRT